MPLKKSVLSPSALAQQLVKAAKDGAAPTYLVVYAGLINGRSWCGDCRTAEPLLEKKFAQQDAQVVYAGDPQK